MKDQMPRYWIKRQTLIRYLDQRAKELGSKKVPASDRRVAESVGVSHTLLQQIRRNRGSNGKPKTHVNMETARTFEVAFEVPTGVLFLDQVSYELQDVPHAA